MGFFKTYSMDIYLKSRPLTYFLKVTIKGLIHTIGGFSLSSIDFFFRIRRPWVNIKCYLLPGGKLCLWLTQSSYVRSLSCLIRRNHSLPGCICHNQPSTVYHSLCPRQGRVPVTVPCVQWPLCSDRLKRLFQFVKWDNYWKRTAIC